MLCVWLFRTGWGFSFNWAHIAPYVSDLSTFTTWGLRPPAKRVQSELTPFPSYQIMLRNNEVILPQLPGGHFSLSPITGAQLAY